MDIELKDEILRCEDDSIIDIWTELGSSMPPLDFNEVCRWNDGIGLITTAQVEEAISFLGDKSSVFLSAWDDMLRHSATEEYRRAQGGSLNALCVRVSRSMVPEVWERERALSYLSARARVGESEIEQTLARLDPFIREHSNAPFEPFGWARPVEEGYMFWLWENNPAEVKDKLLRTYNLLPEASLPYGELRSMMEKLNCEFGAALPAHPASERPALRARRS